MTEPLWIALDLDDVVLEFVAGVCETVNRDFGVNVRPEDVDSWDFGKFLDEHIGYSWWTWLEEHAFVWGDKFKPVPGALGGIEKLRRAGHRLEIVTAKPEWAEDQLWIWMAKYKPRVHQVTIIPVERISKKQDATDADVLVDDKWENCVEWAKDGRPAILYARPHNAGFGDPPSGIVRASSWGRVVEIVENGQLEWPEKKESPQPAGIGEARWADWDWKAYWGEKHGV